jgi:hypothetical protein
MKSFIRASIIILLMVNNPAWFGRGNLAAQTIEPVIDNKKITEIFVSADSPCYVSPETITIFCDVKTKTASWKHSGLVVQGQGAKKYTISKPSQNDLTYAKYDSLAKMINKSDKWYTDNKGVYSSGCSYLIRVKWLNAKGVLLSREVYSFDFKDNQPPQIYYTIISKVSEICLGTDMVANSHIKYD